MPTFGKKSLEKLNTAHPKIVKVMNEAIKRFDFTVIHGHRTPSEQFELFKKGRTLQNGQWVKTGSTVTNLDGINKKSNHNYLPSHAVDIVPYPIDWNNIQRFKDMAKVVLEEANKLGIKLVWGADWDMDGNIEEHKFKDFPHFELDKSEL